MPPSDKNSREAALQELKRQIAAQRQKLDPKVLKLAAQAAALAQTAPDKRAEGLVPYDRSAAAETIRLFLQNHPDATGFEKELLALLNQGEK